MTIYDQIRPIFDIYQTIFDINRTTFDIKGSDSKRRDDFDGFR